MLQTRCPWYSCILTPSFKNVVYHCWEGMAGGTSSCSQWWKWKVVSLPHRQKGSKELRQDPAINGTLKTCPQLSTSVGRSQSQNIYSLWKQHNSGPGVQVHEPVGDIFLFCFTWFWVMVSYHPGCPGTCCVTMDDCELLFPCLQIWSAALQTNTIILGLWGHFTHKQ